LVRFEKVEMGPFVVGPVAMGRSGNQISDWLS
jgi:hypothetical protein